MPKCLNDLKKTYTGKEPSPKGFGYSASAESIGKSMKGKDGNIWIVTETTTCKKWMKSKTEKNTNIEIDFDNLSEDFYTKAYIPITSEINFEEETGMEEKFGGSKPFFIIGETWPVDNYDIPLRFFCQFKDPRESNNYLYRVFLPIDNENDLLLENYHIDKIQLNEENIKNKLIIEKPKMFYDNDEENIESKNNFPPFKINDWKISKELKSFKYVLSQFNISEDSDESEKHWDKYYDSIYVPSSSNKIGGTPVYTQYKHDVEKYPKLLQITESRELPYIWGDSGIAHISEDLILDWDCY